MCDFPRIARAGIRRDGSPFIVNRTASRSCIFNRSLGRHPSPCAHSSPNFASSISFSPFSHAVRGKTVEKRRKFGYMQIESLVRAYMRAPACQLYRRRACTLIPFSLFIPIFDGRFSVIYTVSPKRAMVIPPPGPFVDYHGRATKTNFLR